MTTGPSFHETQRRLRAISKCSACGRSKIVLTVLAGRTFRPEPVSASVHCTCVDGPAAHLAEAAQADGVS